MANRSAIVLTNKFKSVDNKASKTLLTERWIEVIKLAERGKKVVPRRS